MEEFLDALNISSNGDYDSDGNLVIELRDADEFAKTYSKLDRSNLVDEDEESSVISLDNGSIQFIGDDYIITLLSNDDADEYKLTIKSIE